MRVTTPSTSSVRLFGGRASYCWAVRTTGSEISVGRCGITAVMGHTSDRATKPKAGSRTVWAVANMVGWDESYLGKLRARVGDGDVLLFVGARAVLRDDARRVLLIQRTDNGYWALPAGAMEIGEPIAEAAARDGHEETGLTATRLTPFALYTGAAHTVTNQWGHTYQLHVTAFRVDGWHGELVTQTDETTDARFFPPDALPEPLSGSVTQSLADLAEFEKTGRLQLR